MKLLFKQGDIFPLDSYSAGLPPHHLELEAVCHQRSWIPDVVTPDAAGAAVFKHTVHPHCYTVFIPFYHFTASTEHCTNILYLVCN